MYNPGVIVPLGASATSALLSEAQWLGCKGKIGKARGKTFEIEIGGKTWSVFPTYHPAAALHGKSSCRFDIEGDLRTAYTGEVITQGLKVECDLPGFGMEVETVSDPEIFLQYATKALQKFRAGEIK